MLSTLHSLCNHHNKLIKQVLLSSAIEKETEAWILSNLPKITQLTEVEFEPWPSDPLNCVNCFKILGDTVWLVLQKVGSQLSSLSSGETYIVRGCKKIEFFSGCLFLLFYLASWIGRRMGCRQCILGPKQLWHRTHILDTWAALFALRTLLLKNVFWVIK